MSNKNVIMEFKEEFAWLSNFWEVTVDWDGLTYNSSEAVYQAAKCKNSEQRKEFVGISALESKKLGKSIELREDWESVKVEVMTDILKCKFDQNPDLKEKLIQTGDADLIEGNWWGDVFWGRCNGMGMNWLGYLLKKLREEYQKENG
jgi:ribA/ribD-fused uncharacterized protein